MTNYYRNQIDKFSHIMAPLYELIKPNIKFIWSIACERAFNDIKEELTLDKVMIMPDFDKEMEIETDACDVGIGARLIQI